eukprot:m.104448 g.104448  ORF g.104448 m.104448 type:complete len:233 (+) comp15758_c0_seq1:191-889(+)
MNAPAVAIKLCLLGDTSVGKSSIMLRYVSDAFSASQQTTIGASFMTKAMTVRGQLCKFQIWDTAGQEKYRGLAPMYYRGAAVAIFVYDITREQTFEGMKKWVKEVRSLISSPDLVICVVGNKLDLEAQRQVPRSTGEAYAESVQGLFIETSALTAVNVAELFANIAVRLPESALHERPERRNTVSLKADASGRGGGGGGGGPGGDDDKAGKGCCGGGGGGGGGTVDAAGGAK